jgi:DNA processing protein
MTQNNERMYWLAWSRVRGVGPLLVQRLHTEFGSLGEAWRAQSDALQAVQGVGTKVLESITTARAQLEPEQLLEECDRAQINFWTPADPDYPYLLQEIPNFPPVLYYRGQVNVLENQGRKPAIAIVGTRNITDYGRRWTARISQTLTRKGFTIVSGLAAGVDAVAHDACLKAGGRTIAVLGTGIDVIYPRQNTDLYHRIAAEGLILSDYPPGTRPDAHNFPPRNRIIAGLSRAVLVMEAAQRSGALITARYAIEYNRDVYTLPGSLDNPQSLGCLELVNTGAQLILGERALLDQLGDIPPLDSPQNAQLSLDLAPPAAPPSAPNPVTPPPDLSPNCRRAWEAVGPEPTSLDRIMQQSGLTVSEALSALSLLEMSDLIKSLPGQQYRQGN